MIVALLTIWTIGTIGSGVGTSAYLNIEGDISIDEAVVRGIVMAVVWPVVVPLRFTAPAVRFFRSGIRKTIERRRRERAAIAPIPTARMLP